MAELRKDLTLVEVEYSNNNNKATLTFIDYERKESRAVNFNKQSYHDGKFVDDPDKAERVEGWCRDFFGCTFDNLETAVGQKKDVYVYDKFNSLFEVNSVRKFTEDQMGEIYETAVDEVIVDDYSIRIRYTIEGETYESKMTFGTFLKATKEWFVDPQKRAAVYEKFFDKYGVPVEDAQELIGHKLMVEVKSAFGNNYYGDIKKFPKKK